LELGQLNRIPPPIRKMHSQTARSQLVAFHKPDIQPQLFKALLVQACSSDVAFAQFCRLLNLCGLLADVDELLLASACQRVQMLLERVIFPSSLMWQLAGSSIVQNQTIESPLVRHGHVPWFNKAVSGAPDDSERLPFNVGRYSGEFCELGRAGRGGFGTVFRTKHRLDGKEYCVKKVRVKGRDFACVSSKMSRLVREVRALAQLEHRHCIRYYSAWIEPTKTAGAATVNPVFESLSPAPTSEISCVTGSPRNLQSRKRSTLWRLKVAGAQPSCSGLSEISNDCDSDSESDEEAPHDPPENPSSSSKGWSWAQDSAKPDSPGSNSSVSLPPLARSTPTAVEVTLFIQMESCGIQTLESFIRMPGRVLDLQANARIVHQLLSGLQHVHSLGLCHRDLKPANCFFARDGDLKLGDFGLAREFQGADSGGGRQDADSATIPTLPTPGLSVSESLEEITSGVGTVAYAAPEQLDGTSCSDKSDIFSLGMMLVELYSPVATLMERAHMMNKARQGVLPPGLAADLPQLDVVIARCLSTSPSLRPDASALVALLSPLLASAAPTGEAPTSSDAVDAHWELMQSMQQEIRQLREKLAAAGM